MNNPPIVLIVEDDIHIARLIAVLMEEAGYASMLASTATDALAAIERGSPDLVILDRMLPDKSGDEVCRIIKARSTHDFLPVLMLTARSELADRVAGLDAGADDYLVKPFHSDELSARVRALMRIRAAEIARAETLTKLEQQHQELKSAYEKLRSAQTQLVQASKLIALGELVAGVAHELNNPLAIILGNAELLPNSLDDEDSRAVRQIIDAAQRSRRVIQSLITFARHGKVEAEWHRPDVLVERVLDLKRGAFETGEIELHVEYHPDLPSLWGDGPQLQQVLLSLLLNAEQALLGWPNPSVLIRVSSAQAPVEAPDVLERLNPPVGKSIGTRVVVFDIADNGPGIPLEVRDRLFEPYVTTRPIGQGSGMSLAIAYAIIQQHGGLVHVATQPDAGTTFRIVLPVSGPPATQTFMPPTLTSTRHAGRVMVIDDEPAIVDLVTRVLSRSGYTVVGLPGARAALEELQRHSYDMVLCDVRMPDMDGMTFYRHFSETSLPSSARLVIMTGDTNSARTHSFLQRSQLPVLRKPFTRQELLDVLLVADL